ncbi:MAG: response regulator [Pseudobdellovibrionaceae bacterium]|nr:MAG: response regulator [Pseudobdellovibrionaceae bacterium]
MRDSKGNDVKAPARNERVLTFAVFFSLASSALLAGLLYSNHPHLGSIAPYAYALITVSAMGLFITLLAQGHEEAESTEAPLERNLLLPGPSHTATSSTDQHLILQLIPRLRRPLNGIMASLQLRNPGEPLDPEMAEIIDYCSQTIVRQLEDAQLVAEIESGGIDYHKTVFNLKDCVQESIDLVSGESDKEIGFEIEFAEETPKYIETYLEPLQLLLDNIIDNAEQFTESGLIKIAATGATLETPQLTVTVRDTGIGMTPAQINEALRGVLHNGSERGDHFGKTGVGFSIVHSILKKVNGKIWIESEPQFGTLVGFTIPARPGKQQDSHQEVVIDLPKTPELQNAVPKILVVDDEPFARTVTAKGLSHLGYECRQASSGKEALEILLQDSFDLVLMDINMPGMDGWETTQAIKDVLPVEKHPYIMALTSHTRAQDRKRSFDLGMDDFLCKPVDFKRLEQKLQTLGLVAPQEPHQDGFKAAK